MISLTVEKCTASSKGGQILKLVNKQPAVTVQTAFGPKTSTQQSTYYMKVDNAVAVGTVGQMDITQFEVVERAFTIDDPASVDNGKVISLKWLQIKKA